MSESIGFDMGAYGGGGFDAGVPSGNLGLGGAFAGGGAGWGGAGGLSYEEWLRQQQLLNGGIGMGAGPATGAIPPPAMPPPGVPPLQTPAAARLPPIASPVPPAAPAQAPQPVTDATPPAIPSTQPTPPLTPGALPGTPGGAQGPPAPEGLLGKDERSAWTRADDWIKKQMGIDPKAKSTGIGNAAGLAAVGKMGAGLGAPPPAPPMLAAPGAQVVPGKGGALPLKLGAMDLRRQSAQRRKGLLDA